MLIENTPMLQTERLILRKFRASDVDAVFKLYSDLQVNKFLPWFAIKTKEDAKKHLECNILPQYDKPRAYAYAIELKECGQVVGFVNLSDVGGANDLGYGISHAWWGKGIATEACLAVVARLRADKLLFVSATHDINNPDSGKVMKKIKMTYRYTYQELWQPKSILVNFRLYQLDFKTDHLTLMKYWQESTTHFIEKGL